MPHVVSAAALATEAERLIAESATVLRPDVLAALRAAREAEPSESAREVLDAFIENAAIAAADDVPLCQDTGTLGVFLEVEPGVFIDGDLHEEFAQMMARLWPAQGLRASTVRDALLDRSNPGDNTPAFIEIEQAPHGVHGEVPGVTLSVMLKGAGSDNASRLIMANPAHGIDEIEAVLIDLVHEKASMACPPLIIGIGVGATFDKVGALSKRALLRPLDVLNPHDELAALEARLLAAVNATGIGPAARGGATTALAVHLETAPAHIAALPVAINLGCSALRSRTARIC
ncbi:MAG: fumarate hydratase [Coriobacteriia bacterium]|nr:fumarate hydratase [Coriobacteriia bacterium]